MPVLTKRVQVLLAPPQYRRLQAIARARGESLGELIRNAVEQVYCKGEETGRLEAVHRLASMSLPVADWEQLEWESVEGDFASL